MAMKNGKEIRTPGIPDPSVLGKVLVVKKPEIKIESPPQASAKT